MPSLRTPRRALSLWHDVACYGARPPVLPNMIWFRLWFLFHPTMSNQTNKLNCSSRYHSSWNRVGPYTKSTRLYRKIITGSLIVRLLKLARSIISDRNTMHSIWKKNTMYSNFPACMVYMSSQTLTIYLACLHHESSDQISAGMYGMVSRILAQPVPAHVYIKNSIQEKTATHPSCLNFSPSRI